MRTKTQILKTANTLKEFSTKIKNAQETALTPETVKELAEEIKEVAEVAIELAEESANTFSTAMDEKSILDEREEPDQLEMAQDETEDEKKERNE